MKDTEELRALKIASKIMQAAGLCRHDSVDACNKVFVDEKVCEKCIKSWLLAKARKELKKEERT